MENKEKFCLTPDPLTRHNWENYSAFIHVEYRQSEEEGLDVEQYKPLFDAVSAMPLSREREELAEGLFPIVWNAPKREGYPYNEPSDLDGIFALRNPEWQHPVKPAPANIRDKIAGAWYGRICGCLLGKPVEGIHTDELHPLLKQSGNYPMHRYIRSSDVTQEMKDGYKFHLEGRCFADTVDGMPVDDDTNYTVLYQECIEQYGRDFTPTDVSKLWVARQSKNAYCTAERVAFVNFIKGYLPPVSAMIRNPFREWIGAQIRGDYFGYINPGDPETAADMAWRDGCIAQTKNGIYGEMFVAACLAEAAVSDDIEAIIRAGLSQIPTTSRLYERIVAVLDAYHNGVSEEAFFKDLHERWNEFYSHHWCHTISNAEIVVACLLYGKGDYGRSVCMAVEQGFDTDCNGATVGSILGMRGGLSAVGNEWTEPLHGKLHTSIFGVGTVNIDDRVEMTMKHLVK